MPVDQSIQTMARNYMYVSKFPDRPGQIRDHFARHIPEAMLSTIGFASNAPGAVVHRFQISSPAAPLGDLLVRFTAMCQTLAIRIGRPVVIDLPPTGDAVARFGPTGKAGDKILIDVVFRPLNGLLEVIYKTSAAPLLPPTSAT